jgi:TIR domain
MVSVFFSYAHADEALRDRLELHLSMLKRQGTIDVWHDRRIVPGQPFDDAIASELERADLILLLVSPDFLASDYCYDREMVRAMARHAAGEAKVLPVILRPCDWHGAPFGKLLATPQDGKPVTKFANLDDAFLEVTQAIKAALAQRTAKTGQPVPMIAPTMASIEISRTAPRSSNLRLEKIFTDADKDSFLYEAFEFISRYFESSLAELVKRNPGIEHNFRHIDAHQFTAVIYRHGVARSRCRIFMNRVVGEGIAYSAGDRDTGNAFNESLSVGADGEGLFLHALGVSMRPTSGGQTDHLTMEGGAEFYWSMFIEPLRRATNS